MQTARFRWFIFVSLMIHTLLLYLYGFIPPFKPKLSLPVGVDLFLVPSAPRQIVSGAQARSRQPAGSTAWVPGATRTKPLAPSAKTELSSSTREPSSGQIETSRVPGGTSPGGAVIAPGSEGIAIGRGGPPSGTGGTPSATGGAPAGSKGGASGSGGATTGTKGRSSGSEIDHFSGIEIPSYVIDAAGFRSSHNDGGIYPDIDLYVLYAIDKQIGISVPGTEVCIEGDQLHTKERMMITETKIDHSKCRSVESGEDAPPKVICPPEAQIQVVHFDHYASSPLVYSVRTCMEYDRSHCYMAGAGGEGEREVCRVNFQYQGIWAEGTIFDYKCTKSEVRTHRHPLHYGIRWIMEITSGNGEGLSKKQIYQETRTVQPCN